MSSDTPLDVVTVGESLGLLTAERPGRLHNSPAMRLGFGGAESNVAIGVARLGGTAAWIGRVGADALGELIARELRAEGVQPHVVVDETTATALMLKERPRPGNSRITYYRRGQAGSRLQASDIPPSLIARTKILHVTGIPAGLGETSLAAVHTAIDHATAAGALISFDVNHRQALWTGVAAAAAAYRGLAQRAHIVFAGDDEAHLLTGASGTDRQLEAMIALGTDCAVLKRGSRGAVAATKDGTVESGKAVEVPVVDTVGAGDAFVAGWLAEVARGSDLRLRLDTALACGALACTSTGDWEGNPTRQDLAWLQQGAHEPVSR
jgi:2-dehydro-3-deoxygluconokinase